MPAYHVDNGSMRFMLALALMTLTLAAISCSQDDRPPVDTRASPSAQRPAAASATVAASATAATGPPTTLDATVLRGPVQVYVMPSTSYPVLGVVHTGQELPVVVGAIGAPGDAAGQVQWLGIRGAGWVPYDPSTIRLGDAFETLPSQSAETRGIADGPLHNLDSRTGVAIVDELIAAVAASDPDWIEAQLVYETVNNQERFHVSFGFVDWVLKEESVGWIRDMLNGAYDAGIPADRVQLYPYAVVDLSRSYFEERGDRYYAVFGYNSGGSVGFWLDSSGNVTNVHVGKPGEPPGIKLGVFGADPPPPGYLLPPARPPYIAAD